MATFKVVISDTLTGKSEQKEVTGDAAKALLGLKIGDALKGEKLDLPGKTLIVRGGSDDCGFPMRPDLPGTLRKRVLVTKSVGFRGELPGIRRRKTVVGNTIHAKIHQVNLAIQAEKPNKAKPAKKKGAKKGAPAKTAERPKEAQQPEQKVEAEKPAPETK